MAFWLLVAVACAYSKEFDSHKFAPSRLSGLYIPQYSFRTFSHSHFAFQGLAKLVVAGL